MGTGYTRNDTPNNIADGNVINASDLDGEFDAIQAAFNATTGHSHDGTSGEGPQITAAGIANDAVALGTKTTGNYVAAGAVSGVGLSGSASSEGATFTVTSNATSANTASTIVARDASGNFSAGNVTVGNLITAGNVDGRDVSADGAKLDGIEAGATADQTASEILTLIKTVDGAGSGLDADTLDGVNSTQFLRSDATDTATQRISFNANDTNNWDTIATATGSLGAIEIYNGGAGNDAFMAFHVGSDVAGYFGMDGGINDFAVGGWSYGANAYRIWHEGNHGAGSGLDADLLDGQQGSSYLRSDAADTKTAGDLSFADSVKATFGAGSDLQIYHDGSNSYIDENGTGNFNVRTINGGGISFIAGSDYMATFTKDGASTLYHDNASKLATTATGVAVTGGFTATAPSTISSASGYAALEMGGASGAYIDMKNPSSDDYDGRIQWDGSNLILTTSATSGGDVVLQHQGNNTKLRTTATGIDVTGTAVASSQTASVTGSTTLDFGAYQNFILTLTGNITLANPTTEQVGQSGFITFIQTGGYTVSLGTDYETAGGAGITLSASGTDVVPYIVAASGRILLGAPQLAFA